MNDLGLLRFGGRSMKLGLVAILLALAGDAQSLSGKVVDTNGQPVAGALVTALRTSAVPWTSARTSSASEGSFAFSSLTPGTYQFCVQVLVADYLNPCNWSLTPPTTTVTAGSSFHGLSVDDPTQVTPPNPRRSSPLRCDDTLRHGRQP